LIGGRGGKFFYLAVVIFIFDRFMGLALSMIFLYGFYYATTWGGIFY
jgi:hypothetical protein